MKKVVKYQATDGAMFDNEEACLHHEKVQKLKDHLLKDETIDWRDADPESVAASVLRWLSAKDKPPTKRRPIRSIPTKELRRPVPVSLD